MNNAIQRVLIDEKTIEKTVDMLADKINADYAGKSVILLVILKGSMIFASDLARRLTMDVLIDFMQVSSYGNSTVAGELKILKDIQTQLDGKDVKITEDIIDSGKTLKALTELLRKRGANVSICTLLSKPSRREIEIDVKYNGMDIPDEFVVGYGLDYDERYRNLPYIGVLKKEIYS